MANWRTDAAVWYRDPDKGLILAGSFGFVWWNTRNAFFAPFSAHQKSPLAAFKIYDAWESVRIYKLEDVTQTAALRFVRSGLLP